MFCRLCEWRWVIHSLKHKRKVYWKRSPAFQCWNLACLGAFASCRFLILLFFMVFEILHFLVYASQTCFYLDMGAQFSPQMHFWWFELWNLQFAVSQNINFWSSDNNKGGIPIVFSISACGLISLQVKTF